MSAVADVQLGANAAASGVSVPSADAVKQLRQDTDRCERLSTRCDDSVDPRDTAPLAVCVRMLSDHRSTKEE